jgi:hypothetical protein
MESGNRIEFDNRFSCNGHSIKHHNIYGNGSIRRMLGYGTGYGYC